MPLYQALMMERFENLPEDTLNRIGPKELNSIVEGLMALGQAVPDKMFRKYESAMLLQQINECRFKLENGYDQFMPLVFEKQTFVDWRTFGKVICMHEEFPE